MDATDVDRADTVKLTVFLTRREDIDYYQETRNEFSGDVLPASPLLFVASLADQAMLVEIEAICVK